MSLMRPHANRFEACSGFTHVTAHRIAQPPEAAFVTRLQPFRLPGRAARQLPDQSTTLWVDSSSTGNSRLRGALPSPDSCTAANRSLIRSPRPRGRAASPGIDPECLGGAATDVGRRANNAVSHGRCLTSALVRENPQLRRHEVITGRHTMYCPPFTVRVDPVMKPASSVARKTTLRAISSGSPRRLTGISGRMLFSSTSFGTACTISVLM